MPRKAKKGSARYYFTQIKQEVKSLEELTEEEL